jgi:hypothetical protein
MSCHVNMPRGKRTDLGWVEKGERIDTEHYGPTIAVLNPDTSFRLRGMSVCISCWWWLGRGGGESR